MRRLGLMLGAVTAVAMVAGASFAQAPVPVPSYVLFGTIPATSVGTATLACDVPSLISGYVPFAASSSEYYKDAAGVHINFGQPVDYFKKGAGDTNFGGWALLKFNTAKSGTVALDAQLSGPPSHLDVSGQIQLADVHRWDLIPDEVGAMRI